MDTKWYAAHWFLETGKGFFSVWMDKPGNLPVVGTGEFQITRTWSYRYLTDPYSGSQKAELFRLQRMVGGRDGFVMNA